MIGLGFFVAGTVLQLTEKGLDARGMLLLNIQTCILHPPKKAPEKTSLSTHSRRSWSRCRPLPDRYEGRGQD